MVNKSMMHTHASGCHKRRSLPAHSLAAAGLSLLLAFSYPFTVKADANLSAEEEIESFYSIDKISQLDNRDIIKTSYYLKNTINDNYLLSNNYNIDEPIITDYKPTIDDTNLIVEGHCTI